MKTFLSILGSVLLASIGLGAVAVDDFKFSQATAESPVSYIDRIWSPTASSLTGVDASKRPLSYTTSAALDLVGSTRGSVLYRGATGWSILTPGTNGQLLSAQGVGADPIWVTATGGAGDFNGPAASTDNAIVRFDGTGGKTGQNSTVLVSDAGDLTLGTSGPSLLSSLGARGPRQGLVFPGTAASTVSVAAGAGDLTVAWSQRIPAIPGADYIKIFSEGTNNFVVYMAATTGQFVISASDILTGVFPTANVTEHYAYVRSGTGSGNGKIYRNGTVVGTITDPTAYTGVTTAIGGATGHFFTGTISQPLIYNRALTAAEAVALYQDGRPKVADLNSASNTNLITQPTRNSAFSAGATDWISGNGATISTAGEVVITPTYTSIVQLPYTNFTAAVGRKMRVEVTVTSFSAGADVAKIRGTLLGGADVSITGNGKFTVPDFICTSATSALQILNLTGTGSGSNTTFTITDVTIIYSGLLLCPDSAQPGRGATWYATPGTSANVTLGTGVSWALPSTSTISLGTVAANQATIAGDASGNLTATTAAGGVFAFNVGTAASGTFKLNGTLDATTDTSGSFQTLGGAAIKKALWVGGLANVAGNLTASGTGSHVFGTTNTVTLAAGKIASIVTTANPVHELGNSYSSSASSTTLLIGGSAATSSGARIKSVYDFSAAYNANLILQVVGGGGSPVIVDALTLAASTGAATFAGNVTATGNITTGAIATQSVVTLAPSTSANRFTGTITPPVTTAFTANRTFTLPDRSGTLVTSAYGEVYQYENATAIAIAVGGTTPATYYALNLMSTGTVNGFTFVAGVGGGPGATISGVTNAGGGDITVAATGTWVAGNPVTITGTTNYNGKYVIKTGGTNTFVVTGTYFSSQTGIARGAAGLKAAAGSAGNYRVAFNSSAFSASNSKTWHIEVNQNATARDNIASKAQSSSNSTYRNLGASGILTIADGDVIWLSIANDTDGSNITCEFINLNLVRVGS